MHNRKQTILKAIVEDYITTAEPVGSKEVAQRHNFGVSPATIRNTMAELTDEGYIWQPHTSSGRVPTDRGYRYYVDQLMEQRELARQRQQRLWAALADAKRAEDEAMERLTGVMAELSGAVAMSTLPEEDRVFRAGIAQVLRQPEYSGERAVAVADLFEHPETLLGELARTPGTDPVIYIGAERAECRPLDAAMVVTHFTHDGERGLLAIVGPKRMDYRRNVALLKTVAKFLAGSSLIILLLIPLQ